MSAPGSGALLGGIWFQCRQCRRSCVVTDLFSDLIRGEAEQHLVRRDGDRDLRFKGWAIGAVDNNEAGRLRWQVFTVYRTEGGKVVCSRVGMSTLEGETDRSAAHVADGPSALVQEEIVRFFGSGALAKRLYEAIGVAHVEDVEDVDGIPIPTDDQRLQRALRVLGCTMVDLGGGDDAVVWPTTGWSNFGGFNKPVNLSMQALRLVLEPMRYKTLEEVHTHMRRRKMPVVEHPDWNAVRAAIDDLEQDDVEQDA